MDNLTAKQIADELRKHNIEPPPLPKDADKKPVYGKSPVQHFVTTGFAPRGNVLSSLDQDGCAARLLMLMTTPTRDHAGNPILVYPDREEWIGVGVAERDDRLRR